MAKNTLEPESIKGISVGRSVAEINESMDAHLARLQKEREAGNGKMVHDILQALLVECHEVRNKGGYQSRAHPLANG